VLFDELLYLCTISLYRLRSYKQTSSWPASSGIRCALQHRDESLFCLFQVLGYSSHACRGSCGRIREHNPNQLRWERRWPFMPDARTANQARRGREAHQGIHGALNCHDYSLSFSLPAVPINHNASSQKPWAYVRRSRVPHHRCSCCNRCMPVLQASSNLLVPERHGRDALGLGSGDIAIPFRGYGARRMAKMRRGRL